MQESFQFNQQPEFLSVSEVMLPARMSPETDSASERLWQKLEQTALINGELEVISLRYQLKQAQELYNQTVEMVLADSPQAVKLRDEHSRLLLKRTEVEKTVFDSHPSLLKLFGELHEFNKQLFVRQASFVEQSEFDCLIKEYDQSRFRLCQARSRIIHSEITLRVPLLYLGKTLQQSESQGAGTADYQLFLACRDQLFYYLSLMQDMAVYQSHDVNTVLIVASQLDQALAQLASIITDQEVGRNICHLTGQALQALRLIDKSLARGLVETIDTQLSYDWSKSKREEYLATFRADPEIANLERVTQTIRKQLADLKLGICEYNPQIANLSYQIRNLEMQLQRIDADLISNHPRILKQQAVIEQIQSQLDVSLETVAQKMSFPPMAELAISSLEFQQAWSIMQQAEQNTLKRSYPQILNLISELPNDGSDK